MGLVENEMPLQSSVSPPFSAAATAAAASRKEKKKQSKEERDRQKQVEKKRRRLEKALATSAAIRLELEKKKQRKKEEEQRLDEEGAALAEAVALHVLLDEDTEGLAHFKTYAEIDLESLSILSGSEHTVVDTSSYVSYRSSCGPFHPMFSSELTYHSSFAYALFNGGNQDAFQSTEMIWDGGSLNRQVAVKLGHENVEAGNGVQELWIESNHWGERVKVGAEKARKADMAIGLTAQALAMLSVADKPKDQGRG